jgi:ABC-type uncharacterized transport system YnjBCD permease subunit
VKQESGKSSNKIIRHWPWHQPQYARTMRFCLPVRKTRLALAVVFAVQKAVQMDANNFGPGNRITFATQGASLLSSGIEEFNPVATTVMKKGDCRRTR